MCGCRSPDQVFGAVLCTQFKLRSYNAYLDLTTKVLNMKRLSLELRLTRVDETHSGGWYKVALCVYDFECDLCPIPSCLEYLAT